MSHAPFDHSQKASPEELVARFLFRGDSRGDGTIKPQAFLPDSSNSVSVTRHDQPSPIDLWETGRQIADNRGRTLFGRSDLRVRDVETAPGSTMHVLAVPTTATETMAANPNHAEIRGWPAEQGAIDLVAKHIAMLAGRLQTPPTRSPSE